MANYNNGAGYFLYVGDISEVYSYNVPAGGTMFFMNKNQPVLYLKSVNMFNQQTVTEYELVEKQVEAPPILNQNFQNGGEMYVTRSEIKDLISETIRNEMRNNRNYKHKNKEEQ